MGIQNASEPILNGSALTAWRENMGYSERDACDQLGCRRAEWTAWEHDGKMIPRYIGLACAALALGMQPYGLLPQAPPKE